MPAGARVYGVVPPTGVYVREDRCQTPLEDFRSITLRPPIDLMYAMAAFEAGGASCRLRDYPAEGAGWADLERDLRDWRPDAVLLSITTQTLADDAEAAALAKRVLPGVLTLAKGAHFNVLGRESLGRHAALDVVLREEIEEACLELGRGAALATVAGATWRDDGGHPVANPSRGFSRDLDAIPFPARHLARNELYVRPDTRAPQTTLITNRGCPHKCTYCLAGQIAGAANRYRSVENVLAEITACVARHGIRSFLFRSDLFTQNREWVIRLCRAICEAGIDVEWACNARVDTVDAELLGWMRRAGCWIMAFGVESGDQQTLDRVRKHARVEDAHRAVRLCREAGIKSSVYLLMGLPWDTADSLAAQARFACALDPDVLEIFYPYPFPGTELREECVRLGLLGADEYPAQSYSRPAFRTEHLSIDELAAHRARALRRFYLRPSKVVRTLRATRSPAELGNYVRVGLAQLAQLLSA